MKKHNKPRLLLNSETIRELDVKELAPDRLRFVMGGDATSHEPLTCSTKPG